jgi:hypothetical protein
VRAWPAGYGKGSTKIIHEPMISSIKETAAQGVGGVCTVCTAGAKLSFSPLA